MEEGQKQKAIKDVENKRQKRDQQAKAPPLKSFKK